MIKDPAAQAVIALRSISRNEKIKDYLLQNPRLYKIVLKAAMRFIGGETLNECIETAKVVAGKGHAFTVDFMGESTRDTRMAEEATQEFVNGIEKIKKSSSDASISLDISHIGMTITKELAYKNATVLAQKSKEAGIEMMISMEGIDRVDDILELHKRLSDKFNNIGITLQAYLYRTEKDLKEVLKRPGKIRLVKGAYEVSKMHAFPLGKETNKAYKKYMEEILSAGHLFSVATHDEKIVNHADTFISRNNSNRENVEFEMLHGVTPELLLHMHEKGYRTREYLPYGKEWYLYLCHRLAENPVNIYQALADAAGI